MSTAELEATVDTATEPEIQAGDIDGTWVPRPDATVTAYPVGSEVILTGGRAGWTHHLDQIGAIVWGLFDGAATLDELVDDLAAGFQHDRAAIYTDVIQLTHTLGNLGMLAGVAVPRPAAPSVGLEVGEPFPAFRYLDEHGAEMTADDLLGRRTLVVNWRNSCGYCAKIAPDFGELGPALAAATVDLVFLVPYDAAANRDLLDAHGIPGRLLVKGSEVDGVDPFPGMGTPVAYLVDEAGLVAEPLANGAQQVPTLLRWVSGVDVAPADDHDHDHDHDHDDDAAPQPKFIAAQSAGVCGPGGPAPGAPTVWEPARAYQVGDLYVGVKANTAAADAVLARVLAPIRDDELDPPANYSVVLAGDDGDGADGVRGLHMLLRGSDVLVRSRSEARVVHGLLQYLSGHAPAEGVVLFTNTVVGIVDEHAVLLPRSVQARLNELQPKLSRAGIRIADVPFGLVDLDTREVVVREPGIAFDAEALAALPDPAARGSELARVQPGRYPLTAWCFASPDVGLFSTAKAAATAVSMSFLPADEATLVSSLVDLLGTVPGVGVGSLPNDDMVAGIKAHATS